MKIEIFSDIACPWCYVGKRRLDEALRNFAHADQVELIWKSYELSPDVPEEIPGSALDYFAEKGIPRDRLAAMMDQCMRAAAASNITMNFDISRKFNTRKGHELLHFAREAGRQSDVMERLFAASFTEGRSLGGIDALVALAAEAGLDPAESRTALESGRFTAAVIADEQEAAASGVNGVPYFIFNRKYAISGGQEPDVFLRALETVWREEQDISADPASSRHVCDDDNCAV